MAELGRQTGLSRQTLNEWARKPGCPRKRVGATWRYPWPAWNEWRFEEGRRQVRESAKPVDAHEAKQRKMLAEAQLAELDLAERQGQLVTLEDYRKSIGLLLDPVRATMLAVPAKWAPLLVGHMTVGDAQAALEPLVMAALREWAGEG